VVGEEVVHDVVENLPVVVTVAPGERLVAYDRRIGGETLAFDPAGEGSSVVADPAGGDPTGWPSTETIGDGTSARSRTDRRCSGGAGRPSPRTSVYESDAYEWTGDFD